MINATRASILLAVALVLPLSGCDQKPSGTSTPSGTTAPAGGAKSLPGKVVETTKDVVNRANETSKAEAAVADSVNDAAKGAWADLRTAAYNEGVKQLDSLKSKIASLQTTNPAQFTTVSELVKTIQTKLTELKTAGADSWKPLADQIKSGLDDIQKRLGM